LYALSHATIAGSVPASRENAILRSAKLPSLRPLKPKPLAVPVYSLNGSNSFIYHAAEFQNLMMFESVPPSW
jgi:hypothetical protein